MCVGGGGGGCLSCLLILFLSSLYFGEKLLQILILNLTSVHKPVPLELAP